jgi:beta-glucanase (GH16 family)
LGLVVVACAVAGPLAARASVVTDNPAGWNQTFNDDFDGTSMDATKWAHRLSGVRYNATNTPNAVSVSGGLLTITTYTESGTNYTGMIATRNLTTNTDLFAQTHGYFEARMKFQSNPGQWSAFWLTSPIYGENVGNPALYGTEIDVVEHRRVNGSNSDISNKYLSSVHWDGYGAEHMQAPLTITPGGLSNGTWHKYGLLWSSSGYQFYYDDVLQFTVNQAVSMRPEYMILSSEVRDANWAGTMPASGYGTLATSSTNVQVDYVRAYAAVPEPTGVAIVAGAAGMALARRRRR